MSAGTLARLQSLFDHAVELPASEHDAFVAALTGADTELRDDLQRLLARHRACRLLPDQPALAELDRALQTLAPDALTAARTIGPFRIEHVIGDGGMGRVYRAVREHDGIEQRVAIKLVRLERVNTSLLQRFSTERRLLASLDHPGICRFIDAGTLHDDTPYVVMELIDGEPLTAYCDAHRLSLPARLQLLRKVLAAVAHAHRKLIVHRDIKSANVLVDRSGEPRLLDFGIAKSLADEHGGTATAERFFSPASAAPEQIRGDPITVGCDVYALGVLAYELLCGRPPFDLDGLSAGDAERLLLTVPPPAMSQRIHAGDDETAAARGLPNARALQRALRGDLDAIVQRCLRKSAAERYQSVEQLDAELARFLAGQPVNARGGERLYRLRKFAGRNRTAVALSAGLALALIAGGTAIVLQNVAISEQRNAALLERDRAQQIVELLQESFAAANPLGAGGGDVTAAQILDAARPRLERFRVERPDVYASLGATIVKLDFDLQRFSSAAELAATAVEAAREAADQAVLRDVLLLDGRAATLVTDYARAQRSLDEVRVLDGTPQVDWMFAQARLLMRPGRMDEAIGLLHHVLARADTSGAADDDLIIDARSELTDALRMQGRLHEALVVLGASLEWQKHHRGHDHPRLIPDRIRHVQLLRDMGRTIEALHHSADVVADAERTFGAGSSIAARAVLVHGMVLEKHGLDEQAAATYALGRERSADANGEHHFITLIAACWQAKALARIGGHDDEADAIFRHVVTTFSRMLGDDGQEQIEMRTVYARFLLSRGRQRDALTLLAAARFPDIEAIEADHDMFLQSLLDVRIAAACRQDSKDADCLATAELVQRFGVPRRGEPITGSPPPRSTSSPPPTRLPTSS